MQNNKDQGETNDMHEHGCGCDCGCDRRDFLTTTGLVAGGLAFTSMAAAQDVVAPDPSGSASLQTKPRVLSAFVYPPSTVFSKAPDGWWSWPGNDFDAEGRQKKYQAEIGKIATNLDMQIDVVEKPLGTRAESDPFITRMKQEKPDGILLVMFYNRSLDLVDQIIAAAKELKIPVVLYIGLGVKHGSIDAYRTGGVYLIQSLENIEAIEAGMRMISAKKRMATSRLLSITEAPAVREGVEKFFGTTVRVIPFKTYAQYFEQVKIDRRAEEVIKTFSEGATEQRGITRKSLENAARAHLALTRLLEENEADGLTMNCLRRGMLKPCMSFSMLNGMLIPATCENDFPAMYTQRLGQLLTGRPGFQHNPAFETERNHYYGSHCTCAPKMTGPDGPKLPFLLRRFAHTNEGSCAIQVFFEPDQPVTIVRYYPGNPPALDVYAGRTFQSHPMPPAGGCTTNVEVEITDRPDACQVRGHHNLIFVGDFARRFRMFANLYGMRLADTGYVGPWPG